VDDGFHRSPLVTRCLQTLKYLLPCAGGTAQFRLSNEPNRFGRAAQYDRRTRDEHQHLTLKDRRGDAAARRGIGGRCSQLMVADGATRKGSNEMTKSMASFDHRVGAQ
jgi:hypothetical protein